MPSPLFNTFGNHQVSNSPFANMSNFLNQFDQFRKGFNGNPEQMVKQMVESGQVSQEQFNQASNMAKQLMQFMGGNK